MPECLAEELVEHVDDEFPGDVAPEPEGYPLLDGFLLVQQTDFCL